ncbi:hypothetical protein [Nonomuraea sp. NPDC049625]|uniref:hypothetical protein n=1 Tax=Nonomuraea sp. NPDC049625 TaxID=3155775 RepID=UPI003444C7FD
MTAVLDMDGVLTRISGTSLTTQPVPAEITARTLPEAVDGGLILLTGGMGAVEEELLHQLLTSLGPVRQVPRTAAAACAAEGLVLVCDAGERAFTAALAEVGRRMIRMLVVVTEPSLGGRAFAAAVAAASPPDARAGVIRMLAERDARLMTVLRQAARYEFVRSEPVAPRVAAGLVLDTFTAFAEGMRALLPAAPGADALLMGRFADFPPLKTALEASLGREPRRLGVESLARGAYEVAQGRTGLLGTPPDLVRLPMHRIRDGRLEEVALPLPAGLGEFAELDGSPLVLSKGARKALPEQLPLLVRGERHDVSLARLVPGDYRIGVRSAPFGLLFDGSAGGPVLIGMEGRA